VGPGRQNQNAHPQAGSELEGCVEFVCASSAPASFTVKPKAERRYSGAPMIWSSEDAQRPLPAFTALRLRFFGF